jgi:hypothetical protein
MPYGLVLTSQNQLQNILKRCWTSDWHTKTVSDGLVPTVTVQSGSGFFFSLKDWTFKHYTMSNVLCINLDIIGLTWLRPGNCKGIPAENPWLSNKSKNI